MRKTQQAAWIRNHDAQTRLHKAVVTWKRRQKRADAARAELKRVIAASHELGADAEYLGRALGRSPQAIRRTWLPPPNNTAESRLSNTCRTRV